ncbi:MAG: hypothetical protein JWN93_3142 [Hyphomicrobiales bacterium]|nr:hypothetical protein [Hyphomicrobiales bacterium]
MRDAAAATQSSVVEDGLGEDILLHVTSKWVDWYRDNARRPAGDTDQERSDAAAAPMKAKFLGDAER